MRDFEWTQTLYVVVKEDGTVAGVPVVDPISACDLCAQHEGAHIYRMTLDDYPFHD